MSRFNHTVQVGYNEKKEYPTNSILRSVTCFHSKPKKREEANLFVLGNFVNQNFVYKTATLLLLIGRYKCSKSVLKLDIAHANV